ncbi:hypothetical protein F01_420215 [Burkholderia cenocepacia]|nr:hypothetical protein F01_420215 [Burkholderia cenocepacia]
MVNSLVELVVVSGPQVLFHLRAALVYAADFDHRSIICLACRNDVRVFAKTCNHCSREHPASGTSHVRIHRHWPFGQCVECLLNNGFGAFVLAGRIIVSMSICQKSFQPTVSISLPHAA